MVGGAYHDDCGGRGIITIVVGGAYHDDCGGRGIITTTVAFHTAAGQGYCVCQNVSRPEGTTGH